MTEAERIEKTLGLEQKLLEAAQALLAQLGTTAAVIPVPGGLPVRCVAIGNLTELRQMLTTP